jgi:ribosomal protein S18 acetylase RimI-like enzyme
MTATIRPATPADIPAMVELLRLLFAIEADFTFCGDRQRRGLELLLAAPQARVMVAEVDGQTVAMATAQLTISTAEGGPALTIEDVVVDPPYRGRGLARSLLTELTAWGESHGAQRLQLLADRDNAPALAFYHRLGWKHTKLICLRQGSRLNS